MHYWWLRAFISTKKHAVRNHRVYKKHAMRLLASRQGLRQLASRQRLRFLGGYHRESQVIHDMFVQISWGNEMSDYFTYKLFVSLKVTHFCYHCCTRSTVFPAVIVFFVSCLCRRMRCGIELLRNVLYPLDHLFANSFGLLHMIQLCFFQMHFFLLLE